MNRFLWTVLFCAGFLCGCANLQTTAPDEAPTTDTQKIALRNNAVSLLYDLLGDEKKVKEILIIKRKNAKLDRLIDAISASSGDAAKRLEQMAKEDPTLNLHALKLPAGEMATRRAIAKTEEHELLLSSGENFEFDLLLTQVDALSYGWHLAGIAEKNSPHPEGALAFMEISTAYKDLYAQVSAMLKSDMQNQSTLPHNR
jgi:hypothetical protein